MEITTVALFVSISLVIFGISYYYFTTRYKERMTMIERGLPPDYFKTNGNYVLLLLTLGIVCIGISIGIITGAFLNKLEIEGTHFIMMPFSIFLFLGISLVVSYLVLKSVDKKL